MKKYQVSSLPLKEVISDMAKEMGINFESQCEEYFLKIPSSLGQGFIRGINFENGLGLIQYKLKFNEEVEYHFTQDKVHPLKYIYCVNGNVEHAFSENQETHEIPHYRCAIVACKKGSGHILSFPKNEFTDIISLEIDRSRLSQRVDCQLYDNEDGIAEILKDTNGNLQFYNKGYYSLDLAKLFEDMEKYKANSFMRHIYLESKALNMFACQLIMYHKDQMNQNLKNKLSKREVKALRTIEDYLDQNIGSLGNLEDISALVGLNKNKLQQLFKNQYGETVNTYINNRKMEVAKNLIENSHYNISEISELIGFRSKSYFTKIFKSHFEISPSEYKKMAMHN